VAGRSTPSNSVTPNVGRLRARVSATFLRREPAVDSVAERAPANASAASVVRGSVYSLLNLAYPSGSAAILVSGQRPAAISSTVGPPIGAKPGLRGGVGVVGVSTSSNGSVIASGRRVIILPLVAPGIQPSTAPSNPPAAEDSVSSSLCHSVYSAKRPSPLM
jgi:hypothetical protein